MNTKTLHSGYGNPAFAHGIVQLVLLCFAASASTEGRLSKLQLQGANPTHLSSGPPRKFTTLRRISSLAIAGFSLFLFVLLLMHFIHTEISFKDRFLSEYVLGEHGWLLNIAFAGNLIGSVAFLVAVYWAYPPPHRSTAALMCFGFATLAILTNFFPADPYGRAVTLSGHIHNIGGFLGGLAALGFFVIQSARLHSLGLIRGRYRALQVLAFLGPILFIVVALAAARASEIVGIVQRAYVLTLMLWLILAANGMRTGALLVKGSKPLVNSDSVESLC